MATSTMKSKVALVTGASSGIGRAIATQMALEDIIVVGLSRRGECAPGCIGMCGDLLHFDTLEPVFDTIKRHGKLDVLVHAAGLCYCGDDERLLNEQYRVNVLAPEYLSRQLSDMLVQSKGQVIFLNSLAALSTRRWEIREYANTKRGLKSVADVLRTQLNDKGVRVTSIYLGQVATPMQEEEYKRQGLTYHPKALMQPEDVAGVVANIINLPRNAEVTDITLRSTHLPVQEPVSA